MPLLMPVLATIVGLILLAWSAERFVEGAAAVARRAKVPPLLIGMLVIGFGTSAPEMMVSALAASLGNPGLALGNAYGSNITNIALILGLTAIICPITVHSGLLRKELPIFAAVTAVAAWQLTDGRITRPEAVTLLLLFTGLIGWLIYLGMKKGEDPFGTDVEHELDSKAMATGRAVAWLIIGLVVLLASSRLLLWGAVELARSLGMSDLLIGLTVVALSTSLPELASSIIAARKNEPDLIIGNVIGSNLFNTLAVVGIAGAIRPMDVGPEIYVRDILVLAFLTLSLFGFGYGFGRTGRINRYEGIALFASYLGYLGYLIFKALN